MSDTSVAEVEIDRVGAAGAALDNAA